MDVKDYHRTLTPWTVAGLLLAAAGTAHAASLSGKADAFLTRTGTGRTGARAVILTLDGALTPARRARLAALGADVTRNLPLIHAAAVRVPARNLARLAALPFVTRLSADAGVKKCDEFTTASSGAGYAAQQYGVTGQGVTVAVVDSGIQACHADLCQPNGTYRVVAAPAFVAGGSSSYWTDSCGHGTHVAGIIGGNGALSTGPQYTHTFMGIAPKTNLVSVRVLDMNGQSTVSTVVAGIQWVVTNKSAYNIRVLNLSLGHPVGESYTTDPLCQAVEAAWKAGIVVVCAAGNGGRLNATVTAGASNEGWGTAYGSIQSPANDPYVITVGATKYMDGSRGDDRIATYSSRGPSRGDLILKPDIIAPGNKVISLDVDFSVLNSDFADTNMVPYGLYSTTAGTSNQSSAGSSNEYFVLSGTSMAAPVVAGAAALLLQASPTLTPDTVKARLMLSADKWVAPDGTADPLTYGAGYLNIPAALSSTAAPTKSALSPKVYVSAGKAYVDTSQIGSQSVWGSKAISGVSTVWGSKAISGVNTVASSKAISGVNTVAASKAVSGTFAPTVDLSSVAVNGE